jgi:hypothetical protein
MLYRILCNDVQQEVDKFNPDLNLGLFYNLSLQFSMYLNLLFDLSLTSNIIFSVQRLFCML